MKDIQSLSLLFANDDIFYYYKIEQQKSYI